MARIRDKKEEESKNTFFRKLKKPLKIKGFLMVPVR